MLIQAVGAPASAASLLEGAETSQLDKRVSCYPRLPYEDLPGEHG